MLYNCAGLVHFIYRSLGTRTQTNTHTYWRQCNPNDGAAPAFQVVWIIPTLL